MASVIAGCTSLSRGRTHAPRAAQKTAAKLSYPSVTMVKPAPPTRLPVQERRVLIVEAAGRLFGERGYEATRLADVAAAAGVTKPIVYRHFDSKKALYLALLTRHRDDLGSFADAIPAAGPPEERLRTVLEGWFAYV